MLVNYHEVRLQLLKLNLTLNKAYTSKYFSQIHFTSEAFHYIFQIFRATAIASLVFFMMYPLTTIILHVIIFGLSTTNVINGLFSCMVPFNFLGRTLASTKLYLFLYICIDEVLKFLDVSLFGISYYLYQVAQQDSYGSDTQFAAMNSFTSPLGVSAIIRWGQILYVHFALVPTYKSAHLCFPSFEDEKKRQKSFPPEFEAQSKV